MAFIYKVKEFILEKKIPTIFNRDDLLKVFSEVEIKNISNYDIKNLNSSNKNKKVLYSREISNKLYYVFQ